MAVETYSGFEPPSEESKIWRYLDQAEFDSLIRESALYFASARQFVDKFEGSITVLDAARRRAVAANHAADTWDRTGTPEVN